MAVKSGFYNAMLVNDEYDRTYSAYEYTQFYAAFIKDGVRRSGENDFYCSANGLIVSVAPGYAICGSKWVHNDSIYTFNEITPPVGEYSRIDGVFIHVDTNEATRAASLVYRTGTPASNPDAPAKSSDAGVFELMICAVKVDPSASTVTIYDTRGDSVACGWITTPVGYDDYFTSLDSAFNDFLEDSREEFDAWFDDVREDLAVATLFKQYTWRVVTSGTQTTDVTFDIPQYDPTGVDIVEVYTNGMRETENVDYTISGSTITFTESKIAGTEIVVLVYKSIDGTGLGSVSDEVTALQNQVDDMQDAYVYNYICNGLTDNVDLRTLVQSFQSNLGYHAAVKINIIGNFGASVPAAYLTGSGSTEKHGILFYFGTGWDNKKIILDFANCNQINIDGKDVRNVEDPDDTGVMYVFALQGTVEIRNMVGSFVNIRYFQSLQLTNVMYVYNSRIFMTFDMDYSTIPNGNAWFMQNGVCEDSYIEVTNGNCFVGTDNSYSIVVKNCECYAFGFENTATGNVVYIASNANCVVLTDSLFCPTKAKTGFIQKNAIIENTRSTALATYIGTVTLLTISAPNQNIIGTIASPRVLWSRTWTN